MHKIPKGIRARKQPQECGEGLMKLGKVVVGEEESRLVPQATDGGVKQGICVPGFMCLINYEDGELVVRRVI